MCKHSLYLFVSEAWKLLFLMFLLIIFSCNKKVPVTSNNPEVETVVVMVDTLHEKPAQPPFDTIILTYNVTIKHYFEFMDTLVCRYDTLAPYPISEHLIVRANPWIIDRLENTDYYRMMEQGIFVYDQQKLTPLLKGDTIFIPNRQKAEAFDEEQKNIVLDLNIPEFKLRIYNGKDTLYTFKVRVGQNRNRYLAMNRRNTDLRTSTGVGYIFRINKNPRYINPVDNKVYKITHRDDGRVTRLPRIPWLEPEIAGRRPGNLIHPTTNPETLGKAYSNGCVGTSEADAWRIYYYAPVGTKVVFRYDLHVVSAQGETIRLKDIYGYGKVQKKKASGEDHSGS